MIPYIKQGKTLGFYEDEIIEWLNGFRNLNASATLSLADRYLNKDFR